MTSVRQQVFARDGFRCLYCHRSLLRRRRYPPRCPHRPTLDHVVPRSQNGGYTTTNLITACAECNHRRGNRPVREFATAEAYRRIQHALRLSRDARKAMATA